MMSWQTVVKVRCTPGNKGVEILVNENGGKDEKWEPFLVMTKETARMLAQQLKQAARLKLNDSF